MVVAAKQEVGLLIMISMPHYTLPNSKGFPPAGSTHSLITVMYLLGTVTVCKRLSSRIQIMAAPTIPSSLIHVTVSFTITAYCSTRNLVSSTENTGWI